MEGWGDDGVMILGEGSSLNLDGLSSLSETFLGVVKLDGFTFLGVVSGWKEEVAKVECSTDGEDVSFDWKGVSPFDARDGERILGSSSFNLFKASRRMEEEWMLQSKKLFSFIKSSCEEWGMWFLKDEALSMSLVWTYDSWKQELCESSSRYCKEMSSFLKE